MSSSTQINKWQGICGLCELLCLFRDPFQSVKQLFDVEQWLPVGVCVPQHR